MNIGINARYLQKKHTGIENYLLNLLKQLISLDTNNNYFLYFGNHKPVPSVVPGGGAVTRIASMPTNSQLMRMIWDQVGLPHALKKDSITVFHEPSFISPLIKVCPTVITVFDLAYLYFPEHFTRRNVLYLKTLLPYSIKKADCIIAISKHTKNDIIKHYNVTPEKVRVVYLGVDPFFRVVDQKDRIAQIKRSYGITKEYLLNVSLISPRKNLITLLKAFKKLCTQNNHRYQLVIAGEKGWVYEKIFAAVSSLGLEDDVVFTGYVTNEELIYLYNNAISFLYPSLFEGFGLPILEAMACGCPVITSRVTSIPEVCGEAAVLVDPNSEDELFHAMHRIVGDSEKRHSLREKGFKQAALFSWEKTAQQTRAIYEEIQ